MAKLDQHPTVIRFYERQPQGTADQTPLRLSQAWLRDQALALGADDVGMVALERPELDDQRAEILAAFPWTRTLISFVCTMNREPIRSPARSVANGEFHHSTDHTTAVAHRLTRLLEAHGARAVNPGAAFPMEVERFPGKTWIVSHKPVAVAAGLGHMGLHRNVIHPRFGNFILLGTVLTDARIDGEDTPIDYNPCLECKLCVAACPVGAISPEGAFNFTACFTHNYREFMGGFTDWVTTLTNSQSSQEYFAQVSPGETASMWQSLSFGANYKSAYCMAVCPAGEDVIGPFLRDRAGFVREVVKPLQDKVETVYVAAGSDAEAYVRRRFPHKRAKPVGTGIRFATIAEFLHNLPGGFQRGQARGVTATYHWRFTGAERHDVTITIKDQAVEILDGHVGTADIRIIADSRTWLGILASEESLAWALVRRKLRIKGHPRWMSVFQRCFAA